MRYLGFDLGTRTLGISISDETKTIASILTTIRFNDSEYESIIPEIKKIIEEHNVEKIVLGLPKNMNNSLGFASSRSMEFYELLKTKFDLNIHLQDERLSTVEAERILINNGNMRREKRKNVIDSVAAMIILENFLKKESNLNE